MNVCHLYNGHLEWNGCSVWLEFQYAAQPPHQFRIYTIPLLCVNENLSLIL